MDRCSDKTGQETSADSSVWESPAVVPPLPASARRSAGRANAERARSMTTLLRSPAHTVETSGGCVRVRVCAWTCLPLRVRRLPFCRAKYVGSSVLDLWRCLHSYTGPDMREGARASYHVQQECQIVPCSLPYKGWSGNFQPQHLSLKWYIPPFNRQAHW